MEGHHQSDRPGVRIGAVIAVAIAVAVGVWLLFLRDDDESSAPAELGQPFIGSAEDIGELADSAGHTVYWAGEQPDSELELTEYEDGRVYVRYLTGGVEAGDPNPSYLTVGSYAFVDAYGALKRLADARATSGPTSTTGPSSSTTPRLPRASTWPRRARTSRSRCSPRSRAGPRDRRIRVSRPRRLSIDLLLNWLLFPAVLLGLAIGSALLLEAILGRRLPGALLPGAGLARDHSGGSVTTAVGRPGGLTIPLLVALAAAGWLVSLPWARGGPNPAAAACAALAFAIFAAPVLFSGEATFAGYIKLDDTSTWMTLTDHVLEHGRDVEHARPVHLRGHAADQPRLSSYPIGTFLPLGAATALSGQDVAWTIQPYMAAAAAILALGMWEVSAARAAARLDARGRRRPGLRLGAALRLRALGRHQGDRHRRPGGHRRRPRPAAIAARSGWREAVPLGIVAAAIVGTLSAGGVVWLVPILAGALALAVLTRGAESALGARRRSRRRCRARPAGPARGRPLPAVLERCPHQRDRARQPDRAPPLRPDRRYLAGRGLPRRPRRRRAGGDPDRDRRDRRRDRGLGRPARARGAFLLFVVGVPLAGLVIYAIGSPWVDAKALASASPAILLAALCGAGALYLEGRRIEGGLLGAAVAIGILWSAGLAYRDVSLAPRDQLAELERIGERYSATARR